MLGELENLEAFEDFEDELEDLEDFEDYEDLEGDPFDWSWVYSPGTKLGRAAGKAVGKAFSGTYRWLRGKTPRRRSSGGFLSILPKLYQRLTPEQRARLRREMKDMEFEGYFEDYEDLEDFEDFEDYEDMEADPFLGSLVRRAARGIRRFARSSTGRFLSKAARTAGAGVLKGLTGIASDAVNRRVNQWAQSGTIYEYEDFEDLEGEEEALEAEFEAEFEAEGGDLEALDEMEFLAEMAAEAESEAEADHFIGALAGLASTVLPKLATTVLPAVASSLLGESEYEDYELYEDFEAQPSKPKTRKRIKADTKKAVKVVAKILRKNRRSRPLIKALPSAVKKAGAELAREAKAGKPITKKRVANVLAKRVTKTLASKPAVKRALAKNRAASQRTQVKGRAGSRRIRTLMRVN